ncbi:unnamed protein product, partial [Schistosoma turkestanicum]
FQCSKRTGLQVVLNGTSFNCPPSGGLINVQLSGKNTVVYTTINCPPCLSLCK